MKKDFKHEDIEKILTEAEADGLIKQINFNTIKNVEEIHRVKFEKHTQSLKRLRSEVQDKDREGTTTAQRDPYSGGMHDAIDDIVKAMKNLGSDR